MSYDAWKLASPDDLASDQMHLCEMCGDEGVGFNDDGQFLCADCMFDEACRDEIEETGEFDENL